MTTETKRALRLGPYLVGSAMGCAITALLCWIVFLVTGGVTSGPETGSRIGEIQEASNAFSKQDFEVDSRNDSLKVLVNLLNERSRFAQSTELFRLMEGRDEEFLLDLARQATLLPNMQDRDFVQHVVFRRLGAIEPERAIAQLPNFSSQDNRHLVRGIFHEWLYVDIDSAIKKASTMNEPSKVAVLKEVIQSRHDLSESVLRDIAMKLNVNERFDKLLSEHREFEFVADPRAEWYTLLEQNPKPALAEDELVRIAKLWIQRDGVDVISDLSKSLPLSRLRNTIVSLSLIYAVKVNVSRAFEIANSLPNVNNEHMAERVLHGWGSLDPLSALKEISTIKNPGKRRRFHEVVLRSWADHAPYELLSNIDHVDQDFQQYAYREVLEYFLWSDPKESADLLKHVHNTATKLQIARKIAREWSRADAQASLNWALSDSDLKEDLQVIGAAIEGLAINNPDLALEKALEQPITAKSGVGPEAFVIAAVARFDPEEAISMVPKLREGSQSLSHKLIAYELIQNGNSDRAVELGASLAPSMREEYLLFVFCHWVQKDRHQLIRSLEQLPEDDSKFYAARMLDQYDSIHGYLTDEELHSVNSIIANSDFNDVSERDLYRAAFTPYGVLSAQGL